MMCVFQDKGVQLVKLFLYFLRFLFLESFGCEREINVKRLVSEIRVIEKQFIIQYLEGRGEGRGLFGEVCVGVFSKEFGVRVNFLLILEDCVSGMGKKIFQDVKNVLCRGCWVGEWGEINKYWEESVEVMELQIMRLCV